MLNLFFIDTSIEADDFTLNHYTILTKEQLDNYLEFFEFTDEEEFTYTSFDVFYFSTYKLKKMLADAMPIIEGDAIAFTHYFGNAQFNLFEAIIDQYSENEPEDDDCYDNSLYYQEKPEPEELVELPEIPENENEVG